MLRSSLTAIAAAAVIGGFATISMPGTAAASPLAATGTASLPLLAGAGLQTEKVHRRNKRRHWHGRRHRHWRPGWHFYGGWYYPRRWWGYTPRKRYYRPGRRHVRWCLNRYRSYNPRTDQFLGYDGYYHYCRSPWTY